MKICIFMISIFQSLVDKLAQIKLFQSQKTITKRGHINFFSVNIHIPPSNHMGYSIIIFTNKATLKTIKEKTSK